MSKILYIINILRNFSCKSDPLSIRQITDLSNKYYDATGGNEFIDEGTTRRALTAYLRNTPILNDMPNNNRHANYKIHILYENPNPVCAKERFIDVTEEYAETDYCHKSQSTKRKKEPKSYYYYEPFIPEEEISNLINMVESHPYYTSEEVIQITKSLQTIAPAYFTGKSHISAENEAMRSNDSTLQNNLHDLHHFINEKQDIIIEYSYYNENKELIPHKNYPMQITPYQILWSNGYCYLAAYNPFRDSIIHYRVDRITYIEPVEDNESSKRLSTENPIKHTIKYVKEHPVMMSGDTTRVSLLCEKNKSIVNRLLDSFGINIRIRPATATLLQNVFPNHQEYKPEQWLDVTCDKINPDGVALWAKQYCTECVVYEPQWLSSKIKKELQNAACRYGGQD